MWGTALCRKDSPPELNVGLRRHGDEVWEAPGFQSFRVDKLYPVSQLGLGNEYRGQGAVRFCPLYASHELAGSAYALHCLPELLHPGQPASQAYQPSLGSEEPLEVSKAPVHVCRRQHPPYDHGFAAEASP